MTHFNFSKISWLPGVELGLIFSAQFSSLWNECFRVAEVCDCIDLERLDSRKPVSSTVAAGNFY